MQKFEKVSSGVRLIKCNATLKFLKNNIIYTDDRSHLFRVILTVVTNLRVDIYESYLNIGDESRSVIKIK